MLATRACAALLQRCVRYSNFLATRYQRLGTPQVPEIPLSAPEKCPPGTMFTEIVFATEEVDKGQPPRGQRSPQCRKVKVAWYSKYFIILAVVQHSWYGS